MPEAPPPPSSRLRARRLRTARACDACRVKKNRCDDAYPCSYCRRHGIECLTMGQPPPGSRHADVNYVKDLEEQVRLLKSLHESSPSAGGSQQSAVVLPQVSPAAHADNVEFYGSSSAVALLSHAERAGASGCVDDDEGEGESGSGGSDHAEPAVGAGHGHGASSIMSDLHNPAFSPASRELDQRHQRHSPGRATPAGPNQATATSSHGRIVLLRKDHPQCRVFSINYFASIHHIHPILCKSIFLARCDETMQRGTEASSTVTSFDALYYAVLSLGALVGPREEEPLEGRSNLEWSRLFFQEAVRCRHELDMVTDLAMVQCYFILVSRTFLAMRNLTASELSLMLMLI